MVWTPPKTWATNDILTAADVNTYLRDNENAVSKLSTYTPTWSGTTTAPTLGNGSLVGKYIAAEEWCWISIWLKAGSTTTYGAGAYTLSLPFASSGTNEQALYASLLNFGVSRHTGLAITAVGGSSLFIAEAVAWGLSTANSWGPTTPFTFGTNDEMSLQGIYKRV